MADPIGLTQSWDSDWPTNWRSAGWYGRDDFAALLPGGYAYGENGVDGMGRKPRLLNGLDALRPAGDPVPWHPFPDGRIMCDPTKPTRGHPADARVLISTGPGEPHRFAKGVADPYPGWVAGLWVGALAARNPTAGQFFSELYGLSYGGGRGHSAMPELTERGLNQYAAWVLDVLPFDARLKRLFAARCFEVAAPWLTAEVRSLGEVFGADYFVALARTIADQRMDVLPFDARLKRLFAARCFEVAAPWLTAEVRSLGEVFGMPFGADYFVALARTIADQRMDVLRTENVFDAGSPHPPWETWLVRGLAGNTRMYGMPAHRTAIIAAECLNRVFDLSAGSVRVPETDATPVFWGGYADLPGSTAGIANGIDVNIYPTIARWHQGWILEGFVGPDEDLPPEAFTTTAVALANGIYHDAAFDRLPILADALEDAGCTPTHTAPLRNPHYYTAATYGEWTVDRLRGTATRPRRYPEWVAEQPVS